jgi:hypothetical protein
MLKLGPGLEFPEDAVTQTIGILARKRAGKTNAAKVLVEEMIDAGLPVVVLDPKGDWWGLLSNEKGDGPGKQVIVLGGPRGHLPLEETAGKVIANLVASQPIALILDLSDFPSKAAQVRFTTDFAEQLYRAKAHQHDVVMVVIDEAEEFAPQTVKGDSTHRQLGAFETLVKRGGGRGIGCTMISQRSASLNKNVLTQIEVLVALQTTAPQDKEVISDWVKGNAPTAQLREVIDSLASLQVGEAWVWSPSWLDTLTRARFRKVTTFDSGATPKAGEKRRDPRVLAKVDLGRLTAAMAETIERAEREDPKKLQARIRELEKALTAAQADTSDVAPEPTVIEVPTVPARAIKNGDVALALVDRAIAQLEHDRFELSALVAELDALSKVTPTVPGAAAPRATPPRPPSARASSVAGVVAVEGLGQPELRVLTVLARYPGGAPKGWVAAIAGYSPRKSTIRNIASRLRTAGLMEQGEPWRLTDTGVAFAADRELEQLPNGPALYDYWLGEVGEGPRKVLRVLVDAYPAELTKQDVCAVTGHDPALSTIRNDVSKLRTLGLIDGWRASDDLMEAIR